MQPLIEHYTDIICSLNALKYPQPIPSSKKHYKKLFVQNMEILHKIAINMHEFKKNGGNLQFDYGQGILIETFFSELTSISSQTTQEFKQAWLLKLDQLTQVSLNISPYQLIEQEYNAFATIGAQRNEPIKIGNATTKDYKIKANKYGIDIVSKNYTKRIEHENSYHKSRHCTIS